MAGSKSTIPVKDSLPDLLEEIYYGGHHFFPFPGNCMVLPFHDHQFRTVTIRLHESFAAPHRDNAVLCPMKEPYRPLVRGSGPIDVQFLSGQKVFPSQLHETPATDKLGRVPGIETCIEELPALAGFLDDRAGRYQDETVRGHAF